LAIDSCSYLVVFFSEVKERSGSGDSSGEEDSDEEDEANRSQQDSSTHDEVSVISLIPVLHTDHRHVPTSTLSDVFYISV
jgi:hypothetical protein